ncbi:MAG TPA: amidohydrolase [Gemmatales bacterium]|nr:amidohydrolase [Gemmatales bacterium]HMP58578.1 amidohydrolase [Gemmatales bacterium]
MHRARWRAGGLLAAVGGLVLCGMAAGLAPGDGALLEVKAAVESKIEAELPNLVELYKHLHANPELSFEEVKTAARMAAELRQAGFEVTEKVGGHGVVAVLKNGAGPTLMLRTDLDALPIVEDTGLPYASLVRVRDAEGKQVGVMHACGHDIHMTCWVGTARVLASLRDRWRGTLVMIAQPAEERGAGAKAMLEDGLFSRFPKPDFALALHCDGATPHGQIGYTEGLALANVDSVDIVVKGVGGHGSAPHTTVDPIVIAARIIVDLQTIVSREVDPLESAVVTVGSIHGGSKHNIIPAEVKLQLTVRTFKDSVRKHVLEAIERIAKSAAAAARAPEPVVAAIPGEFTPATYNDPKLTQRVVGVLKPVLGSENVNTMLPRMGGEDFSRYGRAGVPIFMFWLGTVPPEKVAEARQQGRPMPSLHSAFYAPVPEPSVRTGVLSLAMAALELLDKP